MEEWGGLKPDDDDGLCVGMVLSAVAAAGIFITGIYLVLNVGLVSGLLTVPGLLFTINVYEDVRKTKNRHVP